MAEWSVAKDIAGRIKELRRDILGLTQPQFGDLVGVLGQQVSSWERGLATPPKSKLERLAEEQGWPLEVFAEGGPRPGTRIKGPMPPPKRRTRREGCQGVYIRAMGELSNHTKHGTDMSPERVFYWLDAMLRASSPPNEGEVGEDPPLSAQGR